MTRILCVEDNEDNIYLVRMRLEMIEGFDITVAKDGAEGVPPCLTCAKGELRRSYEQCPDKDTGAKHERGNGIYPSEPHCIISATSNTRHYISNFALISADQAGAA